MVLGPFEHQKAEPSTAHITQFEVPIEHLFKQMHGYSQGCSMLGSAPGHVMIICLLLKILKLQHMPYMTPSGCHSNPSLKILSTPLRVSMFERATSSILTHYNLNCIYKFLSSSMSLSHVVQIADYITAREAPSAMFIDRSYPKCGETPMMDPLIDEEEQIPMGVQVLPRRSNRQQCQQNLPYRRSHQRCDCSIILHDKGKNIH